MRILFISNLYPPYELGGMEQLCQEVVAHLNARGHDCHVLTSRFGLSDESKAEVGVTRALYLEADVYHYRPIDFFLRRPFREKANQTTLNTILKSFQPDLVFIWGMWNLSKRIPYWAEQWLPGRVAYNIQSYWPVEPDPHRQYWQYPGRSLAARIILWPLAKLALAWLSAEKYPPHLQFAKVSCCSQYVVDTLTQAKAIPAGAIAIPNGIDVAPFLEHSRFKRNRDKRLRLLYFGGLTPHKGVHTAIEALGILDRQRRAGNLELTIVGAGQPEYEIYLRQLVQRMDLKDKIRFTGRVPRFEIPRILSDHDVFLFTSIWGEPFGRTIIEAMAAGLAVLGSDVGGSREIFALYSKDVLFPPGDAETLAHRIEMLLDEPKLVDRLGHVGQLLVQEHFTLQRMVDAIEAWLGEIVG